MSFTSSLYTAIWIIVLGAISFVWLFLWMLRIRPFWIRSLPVTNIHQSLNRSISLIIPARNAGHSLPVLLDNLAGEGSSDMEIIVVDDCSSDKTADCVLAAAQNDSRIRLISGKDKPESWSGKCWAVDQAVETARGDWLLFCDADISIKKGTISKAFNLIDDEELDCLSIIPAMKPHSVFVSLLIACMSVVRTLSFRPATPGSPGIVQGAFLVVKRKAYDAVGGHKTIKISLLEDVRLGENLTNAGFRVRSCHGHGHIDTQMYGSVKETCEGMTKHLFAILDFSTLKTISAITLNGLLIIFPVASILVTIPLLASPEISASIFFLFFINIASITFMYFIILSIVRIESLSVLSGLLIPFSIFIFAYILFKSIYAYRKGHVVWKERQYPAGEFGLN